MNFIQSVFNTNVFSFDGVISMIQNIVNMFIHIFNNYIGIAFKNNFIIVFILSLIMFIFSFKLILSLIGRRSF
jgi:hypothetical protein